MDIKVKPDHDQLLDAIAELLKGPYEEPPFLSFLHFLEKDFGFSFAALHLDSLLPTSNPLLVCPARERLKLNENQVDHVINDEKLSQAFNKVVSFRDVEGLDANDNDNPHINNFLHANDMKDILVLNVRNPSTVKARLVVGLQEHQLKTRNLHTQFLEALSPYLVATLRTFTKHSYLESKSELYDEVVSRVGVGEIQLNAEGTIVYTNTLADALLQESHLLSQENGKLFCRDSESNTNLQAAIRRYLDKEPVIPSEPVFLHSKIPFDVISLLIRQLPNLQETGEKELAATVGIYIANHTRRTEYFVELLAKLFDFSIAEARVAVHLAQGLSVIETAEELNLSPNTVRSHIARMYDKTGIHREATLVNMLTRTLAGTWMDPNILNEK